MELLTVGDPTPDFTTASTTNPQYHFNTVAGRYVVLCFFQSAVNELSQQILRELFQYRALFDDENVCFFGVSSDPEDEKFSRVQQQLPGIRFLWDFEQTVSKLFGASEQCTYILDERLRVLAVFPFHREPSYHVAKILDFFSRLPVFPSATTANLQAPILVIPRIFEPQLCQALIHYYAHNGGEESGFMQEVEGRTVGVMENSFKRRRDQDILDKKLRELTAYRIYKRLVPEIHKAFQFKATRIERNLIACYDSKSGGFFRPHRDNTTKGTIHRKFAVSLNLNTGEYEGGFLRFPEFGRQLYTVEAGGAMVFSCSLLHEATPVTKGKRYVYLTFLYNDEAAQIREKYQHLVGEN
ncbi:peroxiredoxin [Aphanothece hegewaldii CCALA 016]|uniref:Peroxiredoxin n=1 Tax=Aphanothece hegewaldii CCALA 016 TaxID=2107694 RepID=A0A2T1M3P2_9CHRO|nr:2OG-Fe(II) oxygenase [Aphanothece hegewaldii]PSF39461.1 peroxiredoxin [Aphanothece hegewaldii CCALA 016]